MSVIVFELPVSAQINTAPSDDIAIRTNGPLLITGYSFSGGNVQYVQLYNSSQEVVSLDGWIVTYDAGGVQSVLYELSGSVAPKNHVVIAESSVVPTASFVFSSSVAPLDELVTSIQLVPPSNTLFNNEVVVPSINNSTVRVPSIPEVFYFTRSISNSTGNYTSSFTAFVPDDAFMLASDALYEPMPYVGVVIVEIYPDSPTCSPADEGICTDYVKLYNNTLETIDLSKLRLRTGSYGQAATASNTALLSGYVASGHYTSFPISLSASGNYVWLEDTYGVLRYDETVTSYPSSSGNKQQAWSFNDMNQAWEWTIYPEPSDTPNRFALPLDINDCEGLGINEIAANVATEDQFVEIMNISGAPVVLDGCLLQTNRSTTNNYVLAGTLEPGAMLPIYIKDTPLTLTKTTSGIVYILSSDGTTETDAASYSDLKADTSYALINNEWHKTYAITPGATNTWQEYPECQAGYYRNEETGNCNKIQVASALVACGAGKYRSLETNRCRNNVVTTSGLVPCASNQIRNPATNRCRATSTAVSTNTLKPCAANQQRNPATNRCRKVAGVATVADFPVQAVADSAEATMGWWAFGGVGIIALAYAAWEWRFEVLAAIKKVSAFIPSGS